MLVTGVVSVTSGSFYLAETPGWRVQTTGQDIINIFLIAPLLVFTSVFAYRDNKIAFLLWGGVNLYVAYTYVIYCFSVHFNSFFLFYCAILGISFYAVLTFIKKIAENQQPEKVPPAVYLKVTGIYFMIIACLFYTLWLCDLLPAVIHNKPPGSLANTGLFTNPVQVLDFSFALPSIFLTGIGLLKRKRTAFRFTPSILLFMILMDFTVGFLALYMKYRHIYSNPALPIVMGILTLFSILLLIYHFKK